MTAVVALGTGETSWTNRSASALDARRTAIAWSTSTSVDTCMSLCTRLAGRTTQTNGADVSFVAFVAFGTWDTLGPDGTWSAGRAWAAEKPSGAGQTA